MVQLQNGKCKEMAMVSDRSMDFPRVTFLGLNFISLSIFLFPDKFMILIS